MIMVQAAGYSDIGKVRKVNQDNYLLNESMGLYIVADGMGGHRAGGLASRIAVKAIDDYMTAASSAINAQNSGTTGSPSEAARRLQQSIVLANRNVYARSIKDAACKGMGTTVSALYLAGNSIITANVGDSPIYLLRNGEIENLYTPHTLLHERKNLPKSMTDRFAEARLAHVLTRAVGIRSDVGVNLVETPCFEDDIIVLCSDGLSGKIEREELREMVYRHDSEAACRELTAIANQRGGEDNITIVIVRVTSINGNPATGLMKSLGGILTWLTSFFNKRNRS
jgi:serine/threonine protein phosphatase PrpC